VTYMQDLIQVSISICGSFPESLLYTQSLFRRNPRNLSNLRLLQPNLFKNPTRRSKSPRPRFSFSTSATLSRWPPLVSMSCLRSFKNKPLWKVAPTLFLVLNFTNLFLSLLSSHWRTTIRGLVFDVDSCR
jgi:hypothetical protein